MDEELLIRLLETFADKQAAFNAAHAADYMSQSCRATYEEQEAAYEELKEELMDVVREEPRLLAASLRKVVPACAHEHADMNETATEASKCSTG